MYEKGRMRPKEEWFSSPCFGFQASALPEEGFLWKGMAWNARSLPPTMAPTPGRLRLWYPLAWQPGSALKLSFLQRTEWFWVHNRGGFERSGRWWVSLKGSQTAHPSENHTGPSFPGTSLGHILFHVPPPPSLLWSILMVPLTFTANVLLKNGTV